MSIQEYLFKATHMLKKLVKVRIILAVIMMLWAWDVAYATGPGLAEPMVEGSCGDGQTMPAHDLFDLVIEIADGAANEDELRQWMENDPPVQEAGINLDSDLMISGVYTGDCYLTPLICLFETVTPDMSCVYNCVGMRGSGKVIRRNAEECDFLVGCILFENCLTLCITIIPHDLQPVVW